MENDIHTNFVFDVIVIGAGVMGSSAAYQTTKCGLSTLLLDQFDFLHHRGSSHGESRTTRATYPEDYYTSLVLESNRLWELAEAEAGYKVHFKTSQLDMGPVDNKSLQAVVKSCNKNSLPVKILSPEEVNEKFSGRFCIPEGWIGVSTEDGGVIKPTKAVAMYQTLGLRNGAVLKDNTQVINITREQQGEILVVTKSKDENKMKTFRCRKCVITAGAWTGRLVQMVRNISLPIQPVETTVYYWKITKGHESKFTIKSGFPTFASYGDPYIYGTPSVEFPGLIKIPVHGGRVCEAEERTWQAAPFVVSSLKEWIKGCFGDMVDWESGPVMTQSCMYSMTPDEDFVIDFLGGEFGEDVVVAGGFSGHGFKMAPVVGRIVAEMLANVRVEGVNVTRFGVGRFGSHGDGTGNVKEFEDQVRTST